MHLGVSADALTPLRDGDELTIGEVTLRVLHTPGHSPGGMTLLASLVASRGSR